jgi:tetratricopeptide (TPR) repeat protein
MRIVVVCMAILASALAPASADAQASSGGSLSLGAALGAALPLNYDSLGIPASTYAVAPQMNVDVDYQLGFVPFAFAKAGIGYRRVPLGAGPYLTLLEAMAGVGASFEILRNVALEPYIVGGYHFGILPMGDTTETGGAWAMRAGLDVELGFFRPVGIIVGAGFVMDGGAYKGIQMTGGARYSFGAPAAAPKPPSEKPKPLTPKETPKEEPAPEPVPETKPVTKPGGLTLQPTFDTVFPVFHAWYDENPLGTLLVANTGKDLLTNLRVSFYMKQYMDGKWTSPPVARLDPGTQIAVPLRALFNQGILDINTSTKSLAEITVDYEVGGKSQSTAITESVRLQSRNGMTWADSEGNPADARAAAFVTATDPAVLTFARNIASSVAGTGSTTINENLARAMAMHEALNLFKVVYMPDPKTPYKELVQRKNEVDFLQFPRETLAYRAGDCDDLSILYCALLESLAVETAFITVPGHIFMAVSLGMPPDEARRKFKYVDEMIFEGDRTWIPIEVTDRDDFMAAWQLGAKEWRESRARNQAGLHSVREAWETYEPVNLPKDSAPPPVAPAAAALVERYKDVQIRFLDREMAEQLARLTKQVADTREDPKALNSLGVLYAKYGRYDEAKVQFKKASSKSKAYLSPVLNLGMIALVEQDFAASSDYYEQARKLEPKNTQALLGYARANHELENYGSVRLAFDELRKADPGLAAQFAYLDLRGDEAARAADISKAKEVTLWAEQ